MRIIKLAFLTFLMLSTLKNQGQTTFKELKVGHELFINVPDYMNKTVGLNSSASVQFKNVIKDVAGFVIEDSKEDLKLAETNFSSINEYYDFFIKDFLKDEEKRTISTPILLKRAKTIS